VPAETIEIILVTLRYNLETKYKYCKRYIVDILEIVEPYLNNCEVYYCPGLDGKSRDTTSSATGKTDLLKSG